MSGQEDSMRYNLVTTFHCANCGEPLKVTYRPDVKPQDGLQSTLEQPTGAAMVHQKVSVWPCHQCMEAGKQVVSALKALMQAAGEVKP